MATKWSKKVTREINTIDGAVNVTITEKGVEIQKKGTRRVVMASVDQILIGGSCDIPSDQPEKRRKWFWK